MLYYAEGNVQFSVTMFTIYSFEGLSSGLEHVLKAKP